MESPDEEIANEAIQLIITYSYTNLNPKMKKVSLCTQQQRTAVKPPFLFELCDQKCYNVDSVEGPEDKEKVSFVLFGNLKMLNKTSWFFQDSVSLHKKFIADCYKRLEVSIGLRCCME